MFFSRLLDCLHFPEGFLLSGPPVASSLPQPCSFPCRLHTYLPSLPLRCLYTTPDRRQTSQHQPGEDPIFLFQCGWLTLIYLFNVPTSFARSVNSSGLYLTVTFGHRSGTFVLCALNFPMPWHRYPTSSARWLSIFMNSLSRCVRPFLLLTPRFVTIFYLRPSPSSCWFASNFNTLIRFPQMP